MVFQLVVWPAQGLYMPLSPLPSYISMSLTTASLRRSFRLRKDRHGSPGEPQTPDANHTEFLIYEEVTQYLPKPGDRPRLVVLIGTFGDIGKAIDPFFIRRSLRVLLL